MSDFVTNLARRALGDRPRADVGPSPGADVGPSPGAALARQLALPITTAPAPPVIGAIPSAAPAPVMRQAGPPAAAPPVAPAPAPSSMTQPAAPPAAPSRPSSAPPETRSAPAAPVESVRAARVQPAASGYPMELAAPPVQPRTRIDSWLDEPRGDLDSGAAPSSAAAPVAALPPAPHAPPAPRTERPMVAIRVEPAAAVYNERALRPRVEPAPLESPFVEPVTVRVSASQPDEPRDAALASTSIARPLERAPIAPRVEPASDALAPESPAPAVALQESARARTSAARDAREPAATVARAAAGGNPHRRDRRPHRRAGVHRAGRASQPRRLRRLRGPAQRGSVLRRVGE